jgi:hypothetical protein
LIIDKELEVGSQLIIDKELEVGSQLIFIYRKVCIKICNFEYVE